MEVRCSVLVALIFRNFRKLLDSDDLMSLLPPVHFVLFAYVFVL